MTVARPACRFGWWGATFWGRFTTTSPSLGRGLAVVMELTTGWGAETGPEGAGKVVWFEVGAATGRGTVPSIAAHAAAPVFDPAVLVDVPIRLFLASEARLEALLRELQL